MVLDTTQQIGWAYEAAAETDPINAVDALYWKFGARTHNFTDFHPLEKHEWNPIYKGGTRTPSDAELVTSAVGGSLAYYPTNGVPLFLIMGNSGTVGAIHTVDNLNSGSLPNFTVRSESTGGDVDKYINMVGCKTQMVSGLINFLGDFNFLSETMTFNGIKSNINAGTSLNEIHTTGTKFPTDDYLMNGTELSGRYTRDANTSFLWDTDEMIADLGMFSYQIINNHTVSYVENQSDPEYIDEGNYQLIFSCALWRGNTVTERLFTDYMADSQKTMVFKIYNGATTYRQFTWSNATIMDCAPAYAMGDEKKLYQINGFAEDLSIAVNDGCADDFYED